jgi:hypothetical protein
VIKACAGYVYELQFASRKSEGSDVFMIFITDEQGQTEH